MPDLFGTEELQVQIKVITVDGKKMSRAIFNQIETESLFSTHRKEPDNSFLPQIKIHGKLLGYVKIETTGVYGSKNYLIWIKNGELRKCEYRFIAFEDFQGHLPKAEYDLLKPIFNAPQIFIGA